jgi:Ca2+-binding EF-hand superfamily protein
MKKIISHSTFVCAVLASLVTLSGCGAASADPSDTTPQAGSSAAPAAEGVAKNEQTLANGTPDEDRGHGRGHRGHDPEKFFAAMDKDGDGKVLLSDLSGLPEGLREHLAKADTNQDGALTRDELKAAHEAKMAEWKKQVDTNGDGVISKEEKSAARAKFEAEMKKKLDTNGDGVVSDEEKTAARAKMEQMFLSSLDKNKDGVLTADEVGDRMWNHLAEFDADKDGKIDATELAKAHAAHGGFGRHGHGHGAPGSGPGDDDGPEEH